MKIRLPWIRVTAAAVLMAGVGANEAAAQYVPYRPIQQPYAPAAIAPQQAPTTVVATPATQAPAAQQQYYTAYRTQPAAPTTTAYRTPSASYGSPTGAQYAQPTAAYPQYSPYPQTGSQYPATYGVYPRVAQQPTAESLPAPKEKSVTTTPANVPPADGTPAGYPNAGGPAAGACGCNAANFGAGDYYTAPGYGGGPNGGYSNCGACNTCEDCGSVNQWFGGVYMLGMTRTRSAPIKLTGEIPGGSPYPYYPTAVDTVLTTRDADYGWAPGVEVRLGSTFTIGESCNACQSTCGYNTTGGYNIGGCNSCAPQQMYAWEVAWWGIDDNPSCQDAIYMPGNPLVGLKNFYGLGYNGMPVNDYFGYPVTANGQAGYPTVEWQKVRTNFRAQNVELNIIRFPLACGSPCSGGGCGGYDACGCNDSCGLGFSMYGSCGVRYFRIDDDFLYGTYANNTELDYDVQVDNSLVGPQVGWTTDYNWGRWNLFCNSTFGIFNNHMSVWQRMYSDTGQYAQYNSNGSPSDFNVRSSKDSVSFLGELRVGTAYDISCHWRAVLAYRAIAITGVATSFDQMTNDYSDPSFVRIIDSDNSMVVHGVQVGAECRY